MSDAKYSTLDYGPWTRITQKYTPACVQTQPDLINKLMCFYLTFVFSFCGNVFHIIRLRYKMESDYSFFFWQQHSFHWLVDWLFSLFRREKTRKKTSCLSCVSGAHSHCESQSGFASSNGFVIRDERENAEKLTNLNSVYTNSFSFLFLSSLSSPSITYTEWSGVQPFISFFFSVLHVLPISFPSWRPTYKVMCSERKKTRCKIRWSKSLLVL